MEFALHVRPRVETVLITRFIRVVERVDTLVPKHLGHEFVLLLGRLTIQADDRPRPLHLEERQHVVLTFNDRDVFRILDRVLTHDDDVIQPAFLLNLPRQLLTVSTLTQSLEGKTRRPSIDERRVDEGFFREFVRVRTAAGLTLH